MWKRNRTVQRNVPCHVIVRKQPARHSKEKLLKHWEDQKTARDEKKKKREEWKLEFMKQEVRIQEWKKNNLKTSFNVLLMTILNMEDIALFVQCLLHMPTGG